MKDKVITRHLFNEVCQELADELGINEMLLLTTSNPNGHKWSMAKLFRMWMPPTAKSMRGQGCSMPLCYDKNGEPYGKRAFNKDDAYELFTALHGGVDKNGNRLSWTKKGRDDLRPATNGERFDMLRKHEQWASDRGVILMVPRDSEYWKLQDKQNS